MPELGRKEKALRSQEAEKSSGTRREKEAKCQNWERKRKYHEVRKQKKVLALGGKKRSSARTEEEKKKTSRSQEK